MRSISLIRLYVRTSKRNSSLHLYMFIAVTLTSSVPTACFKGRWFNSHCGQSISLSSCGPISSSRAKAKGGDPLTYLDNLSNRPFATNDHMYKIRHAGGQAYYYSPTGTLKQRQVKLDWLRSLF